MRSLGLSACLSVSLILLGRAAVQTTQDHPPGHVGDGQLGARQLALKPFTVLPKGPLVLRLETFSTTEAAQRAATPTSAVVEAAGKVWLFSLGPKRERSHSGTFVAEIGPVPPVPLATSYVLEVLEGEHGPELRAEVARRVHIHPGPEIFYILSGEQCLETPNGATRARAGEGMVAPANTPMQLNIIGSSKLDAFFVVVHDSMKPRVAPSDWQPKGMCQN